MENEGVFKTSMFGGFDKQSVLTYVDDLIAQQQERERAHKQRADELEAERERLSAQLAEMSARTAAAEERARRSGEETGAELSIKNARIQELEQKLHAERDRAARLEAQLAEAEQSRRRHDDVVTQVGLVMVEAQNQADSIIARAHQQADQIAEESMERLSGLNQRVDSVREDVARLRSSAIETLEEVDRKIEELEQAVKETQGHLYISAGITVQQAQHEAPEPETPAPAAPQPLQYDEDFFVAPCQS